MATSFIFHHVKRIESPKPNTNETFIYFNGKYIQKESILCSQYRERIVAVRFANSVTSSIEFLRSPLQHWTEFLIFEYKSQYKYIKGISVSFRACKGEHVQVVCRKRYHEQHPFGTYRVPHAQWTCSKYAEHYFISMAWR